MTKKLAYAVGLALVSINLTSREDEVTTVVGTTDFALEGIPASFKDGDNERSLAAYGLSSLLQDRTSGIKSPEERLEKMHEIMEQLKGGIWRVTKAAGERKVKIGADLIEAVRRYFKASGQDVTTEQVTDKLQAMTKEQRKAMAAHPNIKALRAIYNAEVAKAEQKANKNEGVDLASLFKNAGTEEAAPEAEGEAKADEKTKAA